MKTVLVEKDAEARFEKYGAAQLKPFVRFEPEKKTSEVIVINFLKQIQSSLSDCISPPKEIDIRLT